MKHPTFLLVLVMVGSMAQADTITDRIHAGLEAYRAGQLNRAARALEFAVAGIRKKIQQQMVKLLPPPLPGWKADAPQAQSMATVGLAGTTLERRYYREQGGEVKIRILADSPMAQMMVMMINNPMMIQADPAVELDQYGDMPGIRRHEAGSRKWEIDLMAGNGRLLIQIEGDDLDDDRPLRAYLKALNPEKLERALLKQ